MGTLDGQTAIVTGAAQGLGKAFAECISAEGAKVYICDIKAEVNAVAEGIRDNGGQAEAFVADVSNRSDVENFVAAAAKDGIDILVNNAGNWKHTPVTSDWEQTLADYDEIINTNFKGVMYMSRAAIPHLIQSDKGNIVHISTYYVLPPKSNGTNPPLTDLYSASKWGLNGFTAAWSKTLEPHNVRVNALCMGATDTPMLRGLYEGDPPADAVDSWMTPEQIAGLLIDLVNEGPDGRTGENIGAWVGVPVELPPEQEPHHKITGIPVE